jgi:alanyl-tRNA synthetase
LRFDVTHFQKIDFQELDDIEKRVNEQIRADLAVETIQTSYVEALELGAMAIFEEKYGEHVRVVKIEDFSLELCGGTHLAHTGEMGYFRIVTESSAAAGIRRLEAVTGERADSLLRSEKKVNARIEELLKCKSEEVVERIEHLLNERHQLEKELRQLRVQSAHQNIKQLVEQANTVNGFKLVASKMSFQEVDELKQVADALRTNLGSGVGVLGSVINDKVSFVCVVTDDLISGQALRAGDIVKQVATVADGSGGGRPHMALAGARDVNKIDQALDKVPEIVQHLMQK